MPLPITIVISLIFLPLVRAEQRSIAFLEREVPRWSRQNGCFSCHNDAVGARALLAAAQRGRLIDQAALDSTMSWLVRPDDWDHNGGEGPFSDKTLARIEFSATLAIAVRGGTDSRRPPPSNRLAASYRAALALAASRLAGLQRADGSWRPEVEGGLAAPSSANATVATWLAVSALRQDDPARHQVRLERARNWLLAQRASTMTDASAVVLGLTEGASLTQVVDPATKSRLRECVELLALAQGDEGGWGPYRDSPTEPFDTALALMALARVADAPGWLGRSAEERTRSRWRGTQALVRLQRQDGAWLETTRPPGGESYSQWIGTAGWALRALVEAPLSPSPRRRQSP